MAKKALGRSQHGFTIVEVILSLVIFPIIVIGIAQAYDAVRKSYTVARQLNEIYAVLSACPEIDRALEFNSLNSSTNCFPNNTFANEGYSGLTTTYTPNLQITNTSSLPTSDPLRTIPDSKVVDISTSLPNTSSSGFQLRLLITRNGVGQQ